jgi:hypothetical protein
LTSQLTVVVGADAPTFIHLAVIASVLISP